MTTALQPVRPDISLAELQAVSLETLRGYDALKPDERFGVAENVRQAAITAGGWIEDPADRDAAQSVLDYWTARIGSLPGHKLPELVRIAPFEEANGLRVCEQATRAYDSLEGGPKAAARTLFLRLLDLHSPSIDEAAGDADLAAAGRVFEQAGVLRNGSDGKPAIAHPALLKARWKILDQWLAEHNLEMATMAAIAAGANAWDQAKRQDSYLPTGAKLIANARYRSSSVLVEAYVAAAERARFRRWVSLAGTLVFIGVVVVGVGALSYRLAPDPLSKEQIDIAANKQASATVSKIQSDVIKAITDQIGIKDITDQIGTVGISTDTGAKGYIWLGNSDLPMLLATDGRKGADGAPLPVDPASMKNDATVYAIRTDVYLRDGGPNANYQSAKVKGVLDEGAQVQLAGPIESFNRPSGTQYWAPVRQVVKAFIQYAGPKDRVAPLTKYLADGAFVVPAPENTPTAQRMFTVIYYRESDRQPAEELISRLVAIYGENGALRPTCQFRGNAPVKASVGVVEAWIDLDLLTARRTPLLAAAGSRQYCLPTAAPSHEMPPAAAE